MARSRPWADAQDHPRGLFPEMGIERARREAVAPPRKTRAPLEAILAQDIRYLPAQPPYAAFWASAARRHYPRTRMGHLEDTLSPFMPSDRLGGPVPPDPPSLGDRPGQSFMGWRSFDHGRPATQRWRLSKP